jgi:hypothetical protein
VLRVFPLLGVLAAVCLLSIAIGARPVPPGEVVAALLGRGGPDVAGIVWGARIPRTALGLLVGVGLGLAGTLMQALTRNPLADPGLLGISAGATFGVVIAVAAIGVTSLYGYIWFAFAGALGTSAVVYALGRSSPVTLALTGVAAGALLTSVTSGIALVDPDSLNRYRFWAAGSLAGPDPSLVWQVAPFVLAGSVLALATEPAGQGQGLLDQHALAGGQGVGDQGRVGAGRGGDHQGVDLRVGDDLDRIGQGPHPGVAVGDLGPSGRVGVDAGHPALAQAQVQVPGQVRSPVPVPEQGHPGLVAVHRAHAIGPGRRH